MGLKVLDVSYATAVRSPEEMIGKIYRFAGIPLRNEARAKMLQWNAANPKDKHGRHAYSLADYGYAAERIEEAFAEYIDFLRRLEK